MKELIKTVANISTLAERTHPNDKKAQEAFVQEHVTKAAVQLGHPEPDEAAADAIDLHDQSLEEPLDQESSDESDDNDMDDSDEDDEISHPPPAPKHVTKPAHKKAAKKRGK
jgi:hypothetical protein